MTQKEYIGYGRISSLKDILEEVNPENIFLVTGKSSYELSGAEVSIEPILKSYQYYRFSDFRPNPNNEDYDRGLGLFNENNYDLIISVGGGSVIDMGKLIKFKSGKPLIAIPTTAGSGSEATSFAVIYVNRTKLSIETGLPDYAIVDSQLSFGAPREVSAPAAMDSLSQAIESYWSVNSTDLSKQLARESILLSTQNMKKFIFNPCKTSRENMMRASNLAGKAINITKTTAPHAVSYTLTSGYNVPHGHAVALTLGEFYLYNSQVDFHDVGDIRGVDYVKKTLQELDKILFVSNAESAKEKIKGLMNEIGLEIRLSELGIKEGDIQTIVDKVNLERLKNNPRKVSPRDLRDLLEKIF